ncbi:MAG: hypothetical protein II955_07010 [Clostridia bacterium]|nr:hypothetical protein [Clostridia bacterium]
MDPLFDRQSFAVPHLPHPHSQQRVERRFGSSGTRYGDRPRENFARGREPRDRSARRKTRPAGLLHHFHLFRLFIASLFPQYHRAIYLDADIVVNGDITELYEMPLGNRLVGAIPDAVIASCEAFRDYATLGVGIPYQRYFNSGVMLMNLDQFRVQQIEKKFVYLLNTYHFETVCPDQDYLNILCRDQVLYLDKGWNKMAIDDRYDGVPNLIHYNNFFKPWQHDNICYKDFFWNYAERTSFYDEICAIREECRKHIDALHRKGMKNLHRSVAHIIEGKDNFRRVLSRETIPDYIAAEAVYEA